MQMFTPFSSIAVFFHELRNIPCYLNVVNIILVFLQHGHKKRHFKTWHTCNILKMHKAKYRYTLFNDLIIRVSL